MNLSMLTGPNFSGRTDALRDWVGLPRSSELDVVDSGTAYLGPDAAAGLSGIASTVEGEFDLMARDAAAAAAAVRELSALGFDHLLDQNPFTLSGGETVVVAVLAALARRPKRLAIDCATEQLDLSVRSALLAHLRTCDCEIRLVDNRWRDWWTGPITQHFEDQSPGGPGDAPPAARTVPPVDIEIIDLSFSYRRGRPVFRGLNLRLEANRHYLLRGPNGSGKTTLSKLLCGLLEPDSGEIRLDGRVVAPWKNPGMHAAYHFQNPDFQLFGRTVAQQFDDATGEGAGAGDRRALGCDVDASSHPLDHAFAMRKRLAVAATLARCRPITLLDEPTLCQDDAFVGALHRALQGRFVMAVSHSDAFRAFDTLTLG